jgi:hypothetical protein
MFRKGAMVFLLSSMLMIGSCVGRYCRLCGSKAIYHSWMRTLEQFISMDQIHVKGSTVPKVRDGVVEVVEHAEFLCALNSVCPCRPADGAR